jgi:hypothetical protein
LEEGRVGFLHFSQGLVKVGNDVIGVFYADGEAQEAFGDAEGFPHFFREIGMGHSSGMVDEGLYAAEAFSQSNDFEGRPKVAQVLQA